MCDGYCQHHPSIPSRRSSDLAAGVIIADQPLDTLVPLFKDSDGNILTQFEGPIAEKVGLLKMDFLGLRTLTTITRAVERSEEHTSELQSPCKLVCRLLLDTNN